MLSPTGSAFLLLISASALHHPAPPRPATSLHGLFDDLGKSLSSAFENDRTLDPTTPSGSIDYGGAGRVAPIMTPRKLSLNPADRLSVHVKNMNFR